MNDHDKNNLEYMLNLTEYEFDKWVMEISEDEVTYALELIKQARRENELCVLEYFDEVDSTAEAEQVLQKFRL